jgi:hypothetical protein
MSPFGLGHALNITGGWVRFLDLQAGTDQQGIGAGCRELTRARITPMATPNCSTVGQSNCSRQDGVIMRGRG